jgi:hypothetical protein
MHNSQRYRYKAAACLRAAQQADPIRGKIHLSMALSWLSLARQDEAIDASHVHDIAQRGTERLDAGK